MALRKSRRMNWRSTGFMSPVLLAALFFVGSSPAYASDVLLRGENSPFSERLVPLSDDELDHSRAMGTHDSQFFSTGAAQQYSIILWDDFQRPRGPGSGSVTSGVAVSVVTGR